MDRMSKTDLVLRLRSYGEEPPRAWTKVELRQRLHALADLGEVVLPKGGKQKAALQEAVTELNKASAKKAILVEHVRTDLGMTVTSNETMAVIQKRAMNFLFQTIAGEAEDLLYFGKYADQTFESVAMTDKSYCEWVKTTAKEESCSIHLYRFANWLEKTKVKDSKMSKEPPVKKEGPSQNRVTPLMPSTPGSASSSLDGAVGNLATMVSELMKEVKELKEEKATAMPRKVAAKLDETM